MRDLYTKDTQLRKRPDDGVESIVVGPVFLALVEPILDYFDEKVIAPNKPELDAKSWGLIR